jgi:LysR family transcriptional regulator, cys regulon transcriptional activator
MKLTQLRYLAAIVDSGFNISAAAEKLHISQPGVSRQLKLLEDELGFELFVRDGRQLIRLTPTGQRVLERARRLLHEAQSIKSMSLDVRDPAKGSLSIATTHTQARYVLPPVIARFRQRYPQVRLHLQQGTSEQIAELLNEGQVDIAISTGARDKVPHCVLLPCYEWYRRIAVPLHHPLAKHKSLTLAKLAQYPLVTYVFNLSGPASLPDAFAKAGLSPDIAITARDSDVIKTYVRLGLGVGVIAAMALDDENDQDLVSFDASQLFPRHLTWIGFRRGSFLRRYTLDFIQQVAPHLDKATIHRAERSQNQAEVDTMFADLALPVHR